MLMGIPWGVCQCPCPYSEPQPAPASPGDPPRPTGRCGPSSYGVTALPWVPVHMKTCVRSPRVEYLFSPVLWSSSTQAPLAFKTNALGAPPNARPPRLGSLIWGSELSFLWEILCNMITFQFVGCPPGRCGIGLDHDSTPPITLLWLLLCLWV